jgi:hypothetical protein
MRTIRHRPLARLVVLVVFSAVLSSALFSQVYPVTVDKVEPPNWRTGPSSNVMLRLSGQHLDDVVGVATKHKGVRVIRTESPDANHLVVWLRISSDAAPGTMMLQVSTRFMTTFAAVPMFEQNAAVSLRGELTADK